MKDKIVIITGASSGIGKACAIAFSDAGAIVVLAARDGEKLKELETKLKEKGRGVLSVITDVTKEEDCKHLIESAVSHFGKIDVLICNAGISMRALFADVDLK